MIDIKGLLFNDISIIIMSIVWGLALSLLLKMSICKNDDCKQIVYKNKKLKDIKKMVFKYSDNTGCYKFYPYIVKCNN